MDIDDFTKKKKIKKKKSFCTPNFELGHETKNVHHYDNTINSFFPPLLCNFLYRYVMIKLCTAPSLIVVSIILDFENLPLRRKKSSIRKQIYHDFIIIKIIFDTLIDWGCWAFRQYQLLAPPQQGKPPPQQGKVPFPPSQDNSY